MRKKRLINKVVKKKCDGCCYLCGQDDYCQLDVHRIIEGKDGGEYTDFNTITTCVSCHRKIHDGQIIVFRKYFSTSGKYVLHYIDENGKEQFR